MPQAARNTHHKIVKSISRTIAAHLLRSRRWLAALGLLGVLAAPLVTPAPVEAQDTCTLESNFAAGDQDGWVVDDNPPNTGGFTYSGELAVWTGTSFDSGQLDFHHATFGDGQEMNTAISRGLPSLGVTEVRVYFDEATESTTNANSGAPFYILSVEGDTGWNSGGTQWGTYGGPSTLTSPLVFSPAATTPSTSIHFNNYLGGSVSPDEMDGNFSITKIEVDYEGDCDGFVRPLSAADEDPDYGTVDWTGQENVGGFLEALLGLGDAVNTVEAFSQTPDANVYAAASGTVLSRQRLDNCGDTCTVIAPVSPEDPVYDVYNLEDNGDLWVVVIDIGGGQTLQYVVQDADNYVEENAVISAGCILGKTVRLFQGFYGGTPHPAEVAIVNLIESSEALELLSLLTVYPVESQACNAQPEFSECMGTNPSFLNNGDGWYLGGTQGVIFPAGGGGGAFLYPGAEVYVPMLLDDALTYSVTVGGINLVSAGGLGLSGALTVRIGGSAEAFDITNGTSVIALEDATPTNPALADGVYEVGVKNTSDITIYIGYACIIQGAPPSNPSACYFENHSFDYGSSGWTAGASVVFPGDGTAILFDDADGTLAQAYSLAAGDYSLAARVRAYYSTEVTIPSSPDGDIDLYFDRGDGEETLGSLVYTDIDPGWVVLTTTFTLSSDEADSFAFYIDINSGSGELLGLTIDRFCLTRDGGYPPPGGGVPPVFPESCELVANPNDSSIGAWISWLWAQLNRFFQCDLMALLNDLYVQVVNGINTMLRFARYVIIVAQRQASWIGSDGIPWLNGHLNNIALGRTTTIIQDVGGEGCHDIFCLLETLIERIFAPLIDAVTEIVDVILGIITQVVGLLLNIVTNVIALILTLFGAVIQFVVRMVGYLQAIVSSFNSATPTPLPGIPQCQLDPQGNAVCIGLWMLENTVFADEGVLYIPLLIGAISIFLLFWLVDTFRREISNLGDKL